MHNVVSIIDVPSKTYCLQKLVEAVNCLIENWKQDCTGFDLKGKKVLVKPNWVHHINKGKGGLLPLVTNLQLLEALVKYISDHSPESVIIGDAPIQGCDLLKLVPAAWGQELSDKYAVDVVVKDYRRTIISRESGVNRQNKDRIPEDDYVLFDLGRHSYLDSITGRGKKFRVSVYDHKQLAVNHNNGTHRYLVARDFIESDVVINVPKMKTHKKAGITCCMKNLVGINGNKEYLPHHRIGGSKWGGDAYPGFHLLKRIGEFWEDLQNAHLNNMFINSVCGSIARLMFSIDRRVTGSWVDSGSWWGNDTVWRMILDLNTIAQYGLVNGTLSDTRARNVWHLVDAVVSGEGDGPLSVNPVETGLLMFSDNSVITDILSASIMGFDWHKIPTLKMAVAHHQRPLSEDRIEDCVCIANGLRTSFSGVVSQYMLAHTPPQGWDRVLKDDQC